MKKVLALAAFVALLTSTNLTAQNAPDDQSSAQYITNSPIRAYPTVERISGSPYENKEFVLGNILIDGKIVRNNVAIRYNALRDEMEIKNRLDDHNRTGRVLSKNTAVYVKILNKTYIYSISKNDVPAGYFLALHEGEKFDLYKKTYKEYVDGAESMTGVTRGIPAMYKEKESYFLLNKEDGSLQELPKSRNGKLGLFKDKKKQMKSYANENRLNVNKEFALIKLLKYYDTL